MAFSELHNLRSDSEFQQEVEFLEKQAKFLSDLSSFRNRIGRKIGNHHEYRSGSSLLVFERTFIADTYDLNGDPIPRERQRYTLLTHALKPAFKGSHPAPDIRLTINENFVSEQGTQWLIMDFTADASNDVRYIVDAVNPEFDAPDGAAGPIFHVLDGNLRVSANTRTNTTALAVGDRYSDNGSLVLPFGCPGDLEDKVAALAIGEAILEEIGDLDPFHISGSAS